MDIFLIQDIITIINDIVSNKPKDQIGGGLRDAMKARQFSKKGEKQAGSIVSSMPSGTPSDMETQYSNGDNEEEGENPKDYILLALKILIVIIFLFTAPIIPFIALSYFTYKRVKKKFRDEEEEADEAE